MKNSILVSCVVSALFLTGCSAPEQSVPVKTEVQKPVIVTSFFPITHLVQKIVGDQAEVVQLLPTGAEAHDYSPTPEQMKIIEKSDLVIVLGESMEPYTAKLEQERIAKNQAFLDFTETVMTIEVAEGKHEEKGHDETEEHGAENDAHHHEWRDPHIWLSPRAYSQMADVIISEIQKTLPNITIDSSVTALKSELIGLDNEYTEGLKECSQRTFVTSHEAFAYLARDYNLTQVSVTGISPEEEPSPKTMIDIIERIKREKITALFSEPLVSQKLINTIALETGAKTYLLHPLESLSAGETSLGYVGVMKQNLVYLKSGLNCQ